MKPILLLLIILFFLENTQAQVSEIKKLYYSKEEFSTEFCIKPAIVDTFLFSDAFERKKSKIIVRENRFSKQLNTILGTDLFQKSKQSITKVMLKSIPRKVHCSNCTYPDITPVKITIFHFSIDTMVLIRFVRFNEESTSYPINFIMLLRYKDGVPLLISQVAESFENQDMLIKNDKFCFGDYNNDGILDFVHFYWDYYLNKISLYEYIDGHFRLNTNYYLTRTKDQCLPIFDKDKSRLTIKNDKGEWEVIGNK